MIEYKRRWQPPDESVTGNGPAAAPPPRCHLPLTKDKQYDAGRGLTIGVINAFWRNQPHDKCPAWMNE
ncbi:hypothetical protein GCM10009654_42060 [Streptomyces hebeiensis]|uniref:Transposase n=1 Tax=Streptomyces hebeiensis TaxID=229486 RepID=A0ABN1UY04_9ACTN